MLSWTFTLCVIAAIALGWFWQSGLSVRERANHAAQDACARMQVQFLDGTVAFASLRLARDVTGRLTLRRTYVFDYTVSSVERRQGFVVMLGQRLEHIGFAKDDQPSGRVTRASERTPHDGKVLNLEDWRRRRAGHTTHEQRHGSRDHDNSSDNGW